MSRSPFLLQRFLLTFLSNKAKTSASYSTCTRQKLRADYNLNAAAALNPNLARYAQKTSLRCWKCGVERKNTAGLFCEQCSTIQGPRDTQNYFRVFGLEESFDLDAKALQQKYRRMQSLLHPDKFTNSTEAEKQISEEYSSLVNKAYGTLQVPLNRALHLLRLHGEGIDEDDKAANAEFLMEMMELNEEVDGAASPNEIKTLHAKNKIKLDELAREISACFKSGNIDRAKQSVVKMKYYDRISKRLNNVMRERGIID